MCDITVVFIIVALNSVVAAGSGLELTEAGGCHRSRPQRDISCRENQEYQHDYICCLNCLAGSYVQYACTQAHERGTCKLCDFDTYTEHDNGLTQCLKCTKCRPDQETVRKCNSKQDTECQCRTGWFCDPDQACEVCKRCTICKDREETVRNCSTTANAVCKRQLPTSGTATYLAITAVIVLAAITIAVISICWTKWKRQRGPVSHGDPSDMEKGVVEDDLLRRKLVPLNGDESLRDCFQYFDELDVDYHNRFFRHIGLNENTIKSRCQNHPQPEDRVFELLTVWREKVGMNANINDLIAALLYLNQRLSAENIIAKAIEDGHFEYDDD